MASLSINYFGGSQKYCRAKSDVNIDTIQYDVQGNGAAWCNGDCAMAPLPEKCMWVFTVFTHIKHVGGKFTSSVQ